LNAHHDEVTLEKASVAEERINMKRDELKKQYFENISNNQDYNIKGGMVYNDIFSALEKVGDHIINVSEAIVGRI
jgi:phosphate:Na+ symporter